MMSLLCTSAFAQQVPEGFTEKNQPPAGASAVAGASSGSGSATAGFSDYVRSATPRGMGTGGAAVTTPTQFPMTVPDGMPPVLTGRELTADRIEGFNEAVTQAFPMTPDMVRQYRTIFEENQKVILERPEPVATIDTGLVSLEPGEAAPNLMVAPGIASVIGFYDATGQAWPVVQYVIGSADQFQVIQLGEEANNLTVTPLSRIGWTNLVVVLKGEPKPVVIRLEISEKTAHYRRDIQIMRPGPNASYNTAAGSENVITEAGNTVLLAALTGVDLPAGSRPVAVRGVNARAWMVGESLFVRSQAPLLSPSWTNSMSGPDGVRVYEIAPSSVALFSVDGTIVRADLELP